MTRTQTSTTKARSSFEVHKSPKKRLAVIASQLATRYSNSQAVTKQCLKALLGSGRRFAGHIKIPGPDIARQDDTLRLKDIQTQIESGNAIVYWVDGSKRQGRLGAGVVWREGKVFKARYHALGSIKRCDSGDAELFAIAAAMRRAKHSVRKGSPAQLVRIYSDAQSVLLGLKSGNCHWIGRRAAGATALEELYDNADWLVEHNVRVELVWVKGHSASIGNQIADEAAGKGADAPAAARRSVMSKPTAQSQAPAKPKEVAPVWTPEWLERLHRQPIHPAFQHSFVSRNALRRPDEAQEMREKLSKPDLPMEKKKAVPGSSIMKKLEAIRHRQAMDSLNIRVVTGRNPKVVIPGPQMAHRRSFIPASTLSVKRTYLESSRSGDSNQTQPIKETTGLPRCLASLLTWGSTTAPCSTRLRKRSRLDGIED